MNQRSKDMINKQNAAIYTKLKDTFNLPVFQDEVAEDERPERLNLFLIKYGKWALGEDKRHLEQDVFVTYLVEASNTIETDVLDIIYAVSSITLIQFVDSQRDRGQKRDTEEFVDQINFIFKRSIKYECPV
ncbi:hypothetical protein [Pontibacillus salipaludis]|uniref:Uncharacterized protein n=1 Tax=Pontibacillus salipaludis TaxID=1697394 RepID=A0ABQ1PW71_9BACI|nr:hypothetical protein [Pontibacillus salipaludis]GGD05408.1 hypothetical protein GCM10011389_11150 [Pontibacillus salipaludis]